MISMNPQDGRVNQGGAVCYWGRGDFPQCQRIEGRAIIYSSGDLATYLSMRAIRSQGQGKKDILRFFRYEMGCLNSFWVVVRMGRAAGLLRNA